MASAARRPQLRAREDTGSCVRQASSTPPCITIIATLTRPASSAKGLKSW
ncbi:Uncharacterised protein [Bordetella pertussis]|nr:Uncharacterised protein [Bordetella pertussis]